MRRLVYALTSHRRRPALPAPHQPKDTQQASKPSHTKNKGNTNNRACSSYCSSHSPAPRPPLLLHPTTRQSDTRTSKESTHFPPPSLWVGRGKRGACCYTCKQNGEERGVMQGSSSGVCDAPKVRPGRCTAVSPSTARPATQLHHKGPPQQASKQASQTNHTPKHRSTKNTPQPPTPMRCTTPERSCPPTPPP